MTYSCLGSVHVIACLRQRLPFSVYSCPLPLPPQTSEPADWAIMSQLHCRNSSLPGSRSGGEHRTEKLYLQLSEPHCGTSHWIPLPASPLTLGKRQRHSMDGLGSSLNGCFHFLREGLLHLGRSHESWRCYTEHHLCFVAYHMVSSL